MRFDHSHAAYGTRTFISSAARLILGRKKAQVDLSPDTQISQNHAVLSYEGGHWWIEDLGSLNGVFVNGTEIHQKTKISTTDRILLGETTLRVRPDEKDDATQAGERVMVEAAELPAVDPTVATSAAAVSAMDSLTRKRLSVFYNLSSKLTASASLEDLLREVLMQLLDGAGTAQRGAVLLLEDGRLLLKAHRPEGQASASLSLCWQAIERREAFIWRRNASPDAVDSPSIVRSEAQSAMYAPIILKDETFGVCCVDSCIDRYAFDNDDLYLLMAICYQVAMLVRSNALQKALVDETAIRNNIVRLFSPKVAKRLLARESVFPANERVFATILCSDVRGFTAMAAKMPPEEALSGLNETFEVLTPLIFKHDGTVDKYVGDSILAVFGSPEPDPQQFEHAIRAAVEMQEAMGRLAAHRRAAGKAAFEIGIGVHCGTVVHGIIGAQDRVEFTVIGDAVNRAARFCDGARKGEVFISKDLYERSFSLVDVSPRTIPSKHADTENDLEGYLVHKLKS
jgi:adenylate cyclase